MLNLQNVCFSYGKKDVLSDFSLELKRGEILAVMGESGGGKTTLLRLIAGLQKPKSGSIDCHAARISYVFQEPRLFPWMTVSENLRAVMSKGDDADKVISDALNRVGLAENADFYPDELSGGMKIRASLARALVFGGDLFLLDEPFSALNEELRRELATTLRQIFKEKGITVILVTHQSSDAEIMADRIVKV